MLIYQAVVTPDSIIVHLHGPLEDTKHDAVVWAETGLLQIFEEYAHSTDGISLQIYVHLTYGIDEHLISLYNSAAI